MNKLELILALRQRHGLSKMEAQKIFELFFGAMGEALARGERVEIRGLCLFAVREYKSYTGRNPKSGKPVTVKPKNLPVFKPGTDLKKRVNR